MLMFENVPSKSEGYVVLPIAEYNRLLSVAGMIRLNRREYLQGRIELEFDKEVVYALGLKLFKERYNADDYDIVPLDEMYVADLTFAMPKKED